MKRPSSFELDIRSIQCTLEALDVVRDAFEERAQKEKFSKREFAEWIGKDPSYVSRILNGRVSNVNYKTIARMLVALGYCPILEAKQLSEMRNLSNYRHCDDADDVYARVRTSKWKQLLGDSSEGEASAKSTFSRVDSVNG